MLTLSTPVPGAPLSVVIAANEMNDLHGTGVLVKRTCHGWENVLSIRALDSYQGAHDFGHWAVRLPQKNRKWPEAVSVVRRLLDGRPVSRILCVVYLPDDLINAMAVQECSGAKMGACIMDDQNVAGAGIPDDLMRRFLERCSLRLATHPELRTAYESKYGLPFEILPAVVPAGVIPPGPVAPPAASGRTGALIGNIWDQKWFDRLCDALSGCGVRIDWFGNNRSPWFDFAPKKLAAAGITPRGVIPEAQLALELRKYPFVIVPAGTLDGSDSNPGVARLSLPGRILFAAASSHTPVLVIGSSQTCAARFVAHFGIGETAPYESGAVSAAMGRLAEPDRQIRMRARAAIIASALSDSGASQWLADSIDVGRRADDRFESLFAGYEPRMGG